MSAFFFFTLLSCPLSAQPRDSNNKSPVRWGLVEKSFGVMPEIDFVNGAMGLNVCRGKFVRGSRSAMAGTGYYAGLGYDTDHGLTYASFGAFAGLSRNKIGGQFSVKGLYYVSREEQAFAIRPEAGIGFPKAQLSYGYNFFTEKTEMVMPTHTVTLYVYLSLHSHRTAMY